MERKDERFRAVGAEWKHPPQGDLIRQAGQRRGCLQIRKAVGGVDGFHAERVRRETGSGVKYKSNIKE